MNIFATDPSPLISAQSLDDKRVNKMLTESAQLICASDFYTGRKPYKTMSINHPAAKWVSASKANTWWLLRHFQALDYEWSHRFDKVHGSAIAMGWVMDSVFVAAEEPTSFYNGARRASMNLDYTGMADTHAAYRMYLNARWPHDKHQPRWTNRCPPQWIDDYMLISVR